ncbi:MAG: hypothetical protein AAGC79_18760 [Pseudomonadota bacterium]
MKHIAIFAIAGLLCGCEALERVAPQTVAGFESGGILGALDGASGAVLARCRRLDGEEFRVAVDTIGAEAGASMTVQSLRVERQKICATAGAVAVLTASEG